MEAQSLSLRLSATESCLVRQYPEDFFRLKHLAKDLQLPYRGQGTAAFAHQAIVALLRRKKETTTIAEGCCYLCGGEAEEIDHTPQQARSTEKTDEKPICRTCHEAKSAEDARWDDGWRPFVSVLNPHTWEGYQLQPRERPFNLIASKPQQKAYVELDLKKAYRHALTHPMDGWCVFSPTDSWTEPTQELAPLSWVEAPEAKELRENGYLGKGWYHRPLLRFLLQEGHVSPSAVSYTHLTLPTNREV